ncbi:MAG: tail fiber domain-containing protein [Bacteroidetes bacterium]|nr:tail fiber domain-containing protein [Bacteroidota bacterium]
MKIVNVFCLVAMLSLFASAFGQVAINNNGDAADVSAMLDIQGTSGGLLVPRMTETDRDALISPATGLIIYQTDETAGFYFYSGSVWTKFISGAISLNDLTDASTSGASVFIGGTAGTSNQSTGIDNTFVGYASGNYNTTGDYNTAVGKQSFHYNLVGNQNSALGYGALYKNKGDRNTGMGYQSLNQNVDGSYNSSLGAFSLFFTNGGSYNTSVGNQSLYTNVIGNNNTAIGFGALFTNLASGNTAVGYQSSYSNTSGPYNSSFGYQAMYSNVINFYGTAIGYQALYNSTGNSNTATGYKALFNNVAGQQNTAVGASVMNSNETGEGNVAIGFETLFFNSSGSNNTAVGKYAFYNGGSYTNSTAIGYYTLISASNQVRIGNSSVTSIGGEVGWTTVSDGRFKTNVQENIPGLNFILNLRPVSYQIDKIAFDNYIGVTNDASDDSGEEIIQSGFIAQEVEQSANDIGYKFSGVDAPKGDDDYYGLRYSEFVVPLVKGMQEQQVMIEQQKQMIEKLMQEVKELKLIIKR